MSTRACIFLLVVVAALLQFSTATLQAEDSLGTVQSKLKSLGIKLEREVQSHDLIAKELARQRAEEKQIGVQVKSLQTSVKTSKEKVRKLEIDARNVNARLESTTAKLDALRDQSLRRLRAQYLNGKLGGLRQVLLTDDLTALERRAYYLAKLKRHDDALLEDIVALHQSQQLLAGEQSALLSNLTQERSHIEAELLEEQDGLKRAKTLIGEIEKKRKAEEKIVTSLKGQMKLLEALITEITQRETVAPPKSVSRSDSATTAISAPKDDVGKMPSVSDPSSVQQEGVGTGLTERRATLSIPLEGRLSKGFGVRKSSGLKDAIFYKGIEITGSGAATVRSVASGTVLFVGMMPSFGQVIIVDHGKREYSLYGRLSVVSVAKGATVANRQALGVIAAEKGSTLYFEVRRNGQAFDPKNIFGDRLR